jgi:serine/threonine protein kinase
LQINVGGYELSTQIGEGAFSKCVAQLLCNASINRLITSHRVYLGSSNDPAKNALHRSVAIKVVGIPTEGDVAAYKKKILKEVKLHKILAHLNILRLLDWSEGRGGSSIWIVLEYAQGGDLFDKISRSIKLNNTIR